MSSKLKRAVIKEELVILTGDFKKAILLNQLIYWSERVKDYDQFITEEKKRARMAMNIEEKKRAELLKEIKLSHGWIYKTAEDLSSETMLNMSKSSIGRHLEHLLDKGWLERRKNPHWKGDNTYQYRVDILNIQKDLFQLGYFLEGYKFNLIEFQNETPMFHNETSESDFETECSKTKPPISKSNNQFQNRTTLPEITTKIIPEIISENYNSSSSSSSSNIDNILNIVGSLNFKNEEDEYIDQISNLFYKSLVSKLYDKKVFTKKEQLIDILKTLQKKNVRIGTIKQIDTSINEFLNEVYKREYSSEKIIAPTKFFAGRLEMIINREDTLEAARMFIRENKETYTKNILFYNWLEQ